MSVSRPALRYHGGKWQLARWIISHFPAHRHYVEPCGGGANVLLNKRPSSLETYNDIDGRIVGYFRVLRNRPKDLLHQIRCTAWADDEYELALTPTECELEQARRVFVVSWMTINGFGKAHSGLRVMKNWSGRARAATADVLDLSHLMEAAERLRRVQLLNRCAFDVMEWALDAPDTLIYLDPPYLPDLRANPNRYSFEWTVDEHVKSAEILHKHSGAVIVSGYRSELYAELYEAKGWQRVERKASTNGGKSRVECLWLNPAAQPRTLFSLLTNVREFG